MFNLLIFLIFIVCLSFLCVFIANIKYVLPKGWEKRVASHGKDCKKLKANKGIVKDYKTHKRDDGHPSKANSWSVGVIGHS